MDMSFDLGPQEMARPMAGQYPAMPPQYSQQAMPQQYAPQQVMPQYGPQQGMPPSYLPGASAMSQYAPQTSYGVPPQYMGGSREEEEQMQRYMSAQQIGGAPKSSYNQNAFFRQPPTTGQGRK